MRYYEDVALYLKVSICYNFTYLKISSLSASKRNRIIPGTSYIFPKFYTN